MHYATQAEQCSGVAIELCAADVDELRRLLATASGAPRLEIASVTLGAALELACAARAGEVGLFEQIAGWAEQLPLVRRAVRALDGESDSPPDVNGTPEIEIRGAPRDGDELDGLAWTEHKDRFRRSLVSIAGLSNDAARKIAMAYSEMADNVIGHATAPGAAVPPAVVGFRVSPIQFEFGVADLGRGVRASLHENERHRHLATHARALHAAIQERASRRSYANGNGFKDLNEALTDASAVLRFRSGDASLTLARRGHQRVGTIGTSPDLPGLQLSVCCPAAGT